jgi:outer membrane protein assembly factor BamE (lipoprotein component of BamABCDE complex)
MKKLFILVLLTVGGCSKSLPTLDGIDTVAWKDDKNGCNGTRAKTIEVLDSQKEKIKALSESQVADLLGKPDRTELYKRNQKFYTYYLEPSEKCEPSIQKSRKLIIRFNGMRMAKEVEIE